MALAEGKSLVNIVRAEIITEEETPVTVVFDTADEAGVDPYVSSGEETIQRVKDKILAVNRTEDIVIGYDITLSDNTLIAEALAIIDGGDLVYDGTDPTLIVGYTGPVAGQVVNRKLFTLNLYTEEKDIDGETLKYVKFSFMHNKGTPVKFALKDGEFFVPEFTAKSRPKSGENPLAIDYIDALPALT